jgi:hypothetical protein
MLIRHRFLTDASWTSRSGDGVYCSKEGEKGKEKKTTSNQVLGNGGFSINTHNALERCDVLARKEQCRPACFS